MSEDENAFEDQEQAEIVDKGGEKVHYTYAVAYARVSTSEGIQNPETQLIQIRKWVKAKGNYIILKEFSDKSTGKDDDRPGLDSAFGFIMRNHRNDKSKLVTEFLIMDFDRLSRNAKKYNRLVDELDEMSVKLTVIMDENLDVNSLEGKIISAYKASTAEDYVVKIGDKIRAGQERAKLEGKTIGRPLSRINQFNVDLLIGYAKMGYSLRDVAKIHNCHRTTITNRLRDADRLDEFKQLYNQAVSEGKKGPALVGKKYKPKKSDTSEN